jgi:putative FmdB family regulatory protein
MPLYDFVCYDCQKVYEVHVPVSRYDEEIKCPHCGKALVRRIAPVRFKVNGR